MSSMVRRHTESSSAMRILTYCWKLGQRESIYCGGPGCSTNFEWHNDSYLPCKVHVGNTLLGRTNHE